jgi:hypothetical protein
MMAERVPQVIGTICRGERRNVMGGSLARGTDISLQVVVG